MALEEKIKLRYIILTNQWDRLSDADIKALKRFINNYKKHPERYDNLDDKYIQYFIKAYKCGNLRRIRIY